MDILIIGIYGMHFQYFSHQRITAKGKKFQTVILLPVILTKISTTSVWTKTKIQFELVGVRRGAPLADKKSHFKICPNHCVRP
jgi:hypothetical protein